MDKIRIAIVGYGNIGKAAEFGVNQNDDMDLRLILTRREPQTISPQKAGILVDRIESASKYLDQIDVAVLCGGSATDLPDQGPMMAALFNTVDSYDTHAKIPDYFEAVNRSAVAAGKTAVIATGWDPGLFSVLRVIEESVLPAGKGYTFWGPGVSQGHSDAIRRVPGVLDARQYTIPIQEAVEQVRTGEEPEFATKDKHRRDCYVVTEAGADQDRIRRDIESMPHYFADYETRVIFIAAEELAKNHAQMTHGGFVMRTGTTSDGSGHTIEFSLRLESNPAFTASVLLAYARAAFRMNREGIRGARTVLEIAPVYLSPRSPAELRKEMI